MFDLSKSLVYFILSLQEKVLKKLLLGRLRVTRKTSTRYGDGYTLTIDANQKQEIEKAELEIRNILNQYSDLSDLFEYIRKNNTKVIIQKNAKQVLNLIKEEEGLFIPLKGIRALYLNVNFLNKFSLKTDMMFVYSTEQVERTEYLKHFYKWYMIRKGLQTPNKRAEELKRDLMAGVRNMDKLTVQELTDIKQLTHDEQLGIDFAIRFIKEDIIKKQKVEHAEE